VSACDCACVGVGGTAIKLHIYVFEPLSLF